VREHRGRNLLIICLYVDNLLVIGSNSESMEKFKKTMVAEFKMTDLGKLSYFLGLEFAYRYAGLVMNQKKYVGDILRKFNMASCNAVINPLEINLKLTKDESGESVDETAFKQIKGSLRYLYNSRPKLSFGVGWFDKQVYEQSKEVSYASCQKNIKIHTRNV